MSTTTSTPPKLTGRQKIAADHFVLHGDKSKAYRAGYTCDNQKPTTVNRNAYRLFSRPNVIAYVEACQNDARDSVVMTRVDALMKLTVIINDDNVATRDRIAAIDRMAKLEGWYKQNEPDLGGVIFNLNLSGSNPQTQKANG